MSSSQTTPGGGEQNSYKILAYIIGFVCIGVFLIFRFLYVSEPAGNDESLYYYAGAKVLDGGKPYFDYYEMKPPMMFYSYALTVLMAGFTVKGMHVAGIIISLLTAILVFLILKRKYTLPISFMSAAIWLLAFSSPMVYGTYLMSEHFVVLYTSIALFFVMFRDLSFRQILFGGIFLGAAILVKQSAIVLFPAFVYLISRGPLKWKNLMAFASGLAIIVGINFLTILLAGTLSEARYWLFTFPGEYVSTTTFSQGMNNLKMFGSGILGVDAFFWTLILFSSAACIYSIKKRESIFALLMLTGAIAAIFPGLRFYPQYWLLIIFAAAFSLPLMFDLVKNYKFSSGVFLLILAGISVHFMMRRDLYFPEIGKNTGNKYMVGQYLERSKQFSRQLNQVLENDDDLLILGSIPQLYLYTGKKSPIRHVWTSMLGLKTEKNKKMQEELIASITADKPEYVVFSFSPMHWNLRDSQGDYLYNATYRFVNRNYSKIGVMDLETGTYISGPDAAATPDRINTYALYKKI